MSEPPEKPVGIRLLVTGSRFYPGERAVVIHKVLQPYLVGVTQANAHKFILVHGDCPPQKDPRTGEPSAGLDYYASMFWAKMGGTCEPYPADWQKGKWAGFARNSFMVSRKADKCLGFPWFSKGAKSSGTLDCMRKAHLSGIPTFRIRADGHEERYTGSRQNVMPSMWQTSEDYDLPAM